MANDLIPSKKPSFWDRFKRRDRSETPNLKQLLDSVNELMKKLSEDGEIGRVLKELNKTLERMDVALKTIEARDERGASINTPEKLDEVGAYKKAVVMLSEELGSEISQLQETSAITGIDSSGKQTEYIAMFKSSVYAVLSCYVNRDNSTLIPESRKMYNKYIMDGVHELGEIGEYSFILAMLEHFGVKHNGRDVNLYSKGRDTLGISIIEWVFGNYSPAEDSLPVKPEELDKLLKRAMSKEHTLGTEDGWLKRMQEVQLKSKAPEERQERLQLVLGMLGLVGKHVPFSQAQIEAQSQVAPGR